MDFFEMVFLSFLKSDFSNKINFITKHPGNVLVGVKKVTVFDEMKTDFSGELHIFEDLFLEVDGED
jgi:hypothetical protein